MGTEDFIPSRFEEFATPDGRFALSLDERSLSTLFSPPSEGFSLHMANDTLPRGAILGTLITPKIITIPHFICRNTEDFFISDSSKADVDLYVPTAAEACALLGEHFRIMRIKEVAGRLYPPALLESLGEVLPIEQYMRTRTLLANGRRLVVGYAPPGIMELKDPVRRLINPPGVSLHQSGWFGAHIDAISPDYRNTKLGSKRVYYANLKLMNLGGV